MDLKFPECKVLLKKLTQDEVYQFIGTWNCVARNYNHFIKEHQDTKPRKKLENTRIKDKNNNSQLSCKKQKSSVSPSLYEHYKAERQKFLARRTVISDSNCNQSDLKASDTTVPKTKISLKTTIPDSKSVPFNENNSSTPKELKLSPKTITSSKKESSNSLLRTETEEHSSKSMMAALKKKLKAKITETPSSKSVTSNSKAGTSVNILKQSSKTSASNIGTVPLRSKIAKSVTETTSLCTKKLTTNQQTQTISKHKPTLNIEKDGQSIGKQIVSKSKTLLDKNKASLMAVSAERENKIQDSTAISSKGKNKTSSLTAMKSKDQIKTSSLTAMISKDKNKTSSLMAIKSKNKNKASSLTAIKSKDQDKTSNLTVIKSKDQNKTSSLAAVKSRDRNKGSSSNAVKSKDQNKTSSLKAMKSNDQYKASSWTAMKSKEENKARSTAKKSKEENITSRSKAMKSTDEYKTLSSKAVKSKDRNKTSLKADKSKDENEISNLTEINFKDQNKISNLTEINSKDQNKISNLTEINSKDQNKISNLPKINSKDQNKASSLKTMKDDNGMSNTTEVKSKVENRTSNNSIAVKSKEENKTSSTAMKSKNETKTSKSSTKKSKKENEAPSSMTMGSKCKSTNFADFADSNAKNSISNTENISPTTASRAVSAVCMSKIPCSIPISLVSCKSTSKSQAHDTDFKATQTRSKPLVSDSELQDSESQLSTAVSGSFTSSPQSINSSSTNRGESDDSQAHLISDVEIKMKIKKINSLECDCMCSSSWEVSTIHSRKKCKCDKLNDFKSTHLSDNNLPQIKPIKRTLSKGFEEAANKNTENNSNKIITASTQPLKKICLELSSDASSSITKFNKYELLKNSYSLDNLEKDVNFLKRVKKHTQNERSEKEKFSTLKHRHHVRKKSDNEKTCSVNLSCDSTNSLSTMSRNSESSASSHSSDNCTKTENSLKRVKKHTENESSVKKKSKPSKDRHHVGEGCENPKATSIDLSESTILSSRKSTKSESSAISYLSDDCTKTKNSLKRVKKHTENEHSEKTSPLKDSPHAREGLKNLQSPTIDLSNECDGTNFSSTKSMKYDSNVKLHSPENYARTENSLNKVRKQEHGNKRKSTSTKDPHINEESEIPQLLSEDLRDNCDSKSSNTLKTSPSEKRKSCEQNSESTPQKKVKQSSVYDALKKKSIKKKREMIEERSNPIKASQSNSKRKFSQANENLQDETYDQNSNILCPLPEKQSTHIENSPSNVEHLGSGGCLDSASNKVSNNTLDENPNQASTKVTSKACVSTSHKSSDILSNIMKDMDHLPNYRAKLISKVTSCSCCTQTKVLPACAQMQYDNQVPWNKDLHADVNQLEHGVVHSTSTQVCSGQKICKCCNLKFVSKLKTQLVCAKCLDRHKINYSHSSRVLRKVQSSAKYRLAFGKNTSGKPKMQDSSMPTHSLSLEKKGVASDKEDDSYHSMPIITSVESLPAKQNTLSLSGAKEKESLKSNIFSSELSVNMKDKIVVQNWITPSLVSIVPPVIAISASSSTPILSMPIFQISDPNQRVTNSKIPSPCITKNTYDQTQSEFYQRTLKKSSSRFPEPVITSVVSLSTDEFEANKDTTEKIKSPKPNIHPSKNFINSKDSNIKIIGVSSIGFGPGIDNLQKDEISDETAISYTGKNNLSYNIERTLNETTDYVEALSTDLKDQNIISAQKHRDSAKDYCNKVLEVSECSSDSNSVKLIIDVDCSQVGEISNETALSHTGKNSFSYNTERTLNETTDCVKALSTDLNDNQDISAQKNHDSSTDYCNKKLEVSECSSDSNSVKLLIDVDCSQVGEISNETTVSRTNENCISYNKKLTSDSTDRIQVLSIDANQSSSRFPTNSSKEDDGFSAAFHLSTINKALKINDNLIAISENASGNKNVADRQLLELSDKKTVSHSGANCSSWDAKATSSEVSDVYEHNDNKNKTEMPIEILPLEKNSVDKAVPDIAKNCSSYDGKRTLYEVVKDVSEKIRSKQSAEVNMDLEISQLKKISEEKAISHINENCNSCEIEKKSEGNMTDVFVNRESIEMETDVGILPLKKKSVEKFVLLENVISHTINDCFSSNREETADEKFKVISQSKENVEGKMDEGTPLLSNICDEAPVSCTMENCISWKSDQILKDGSGSKKKIEGILDEVQQLSDICDKTILSRAVGNWSYDATQISCDTLEDISGCKESIEGKMEEETFPINEVCDKALISYSMENSLSYDADAEYVSNKAPKVIFENKERAGKDKDMEICRVGISHKTTILGAVKNNPLFYAEHTSDGNLNDNSKSKKNTEVEMDLETSHLNEISDETTISCISENYISSDAEQSFLNKKLKVEHWPSRNRSTNCSSELINSNADETFKTNRMELFDLLTELRVGMGSNDENQQQNVSASSFMDYMTIMAQVDLKPVDLKGIVSMASKIMEPKHISMQHLKNIIYLSKSIPFEKISNFAIEETQKSIATLEEKIKINRQVNQSLLESLDLNNFRIVETEEKSCPEVAELFSNNHQNSPNLNIKEEDKSMSTCNSEQNQQNEISSDAMNAFNFPFFDSATNSVAASKSHTEAINENTSVTYSTLSFPHPENLRLPSESLTNNAHPQETQPSSITVKNPVDKSIENVMLTSKNNITFSSSDVVHNSKNVQAGGGTSIETQTSTYESIGNACTRESINQISSTNKTAPPSVNHCGNTYSEILRYLKDENTPRSMPQHHPLKDLYLSSNAGNYPVNYSNILPGSTLAKTPGNYGQGLVEKRASVQSANPQAMGQNHISFNHLHYVPSANHHQQLQTKEGTNRVPVSHYMTSSTQHLQPKDVINHVPVSHYPQYSIAERSATVNHITQSSPTAVASSNSDYIGYTPNRTQHSILTQFQNQREIQFHHPSAAYSQFPVNTPLPQQNPNSSLEPTRTVHGIQRPTRAGDPMRHQVPQRRNCYQPSSPYLRRMSNMMPSNGFCLPGNVQAPNVTPHQSLFSNSQVWSDQMAQLPRNPLQHGASSGIQNQAQHRCFCGEALIICPCGQARLCIKQNENTHWKQNRHECSHTPRLI